MCRIWIKCVTDEVDINVDARVGEECEVDKHEVGEDECIPACDESIKPSQLRPPDYPVKNNKTRNSRVKKRKATVVVPHNSAFPTVQ